MSGPRLQMAFGDVQAKRLQTPNDFVSHMVEHIAWRMGCAIDLRWADENWSLLGRALGTRIRSFTARKTAAAALGMIDDGSAEVLVRLDAGPRLELRSAAPVDRQWFLASRCEQLPSGQPLVELLQGLSSGMGAEIHILVCTFEDPHHTWEGIFRGVGTALSRLFTPPVRPAEISSIVESGTPGDAVTIVARSAHRCEITRRTAESELSATIDFRDDRPFSFLLEEPPGKRSVPSGALAGLQDLLRLLADRGSFSLQAAFRCRRLVSSHVLLEDTGTVVGRALHEVLVQRMKAVGVNGAGSSLRRPEDLETQDIRVGVSVEGRKFWRFVPLDSDSETLKRRLVIGHTVFGGLYSEDLDDFLDGLSWGLGCSLVVHIRRLPPPEQAWTMIFERLGEALRAVFEVNPYRRGLPPGVKANLS